MSTSPDPAGESAPRLRLSKSRFTSGLQCHKQLWWRVHEPDAPELVPDAARQAIFDQGHVVGAAAQGYFTGGVLVDAPHREFDARVAQTQAAIEAGAPAIFEAAFFVNDVFVAVDVLERTPAGWTLVEVKSTTKVKAQHIPDAAVQLHVLRAAGLQVNRVELMHLNRACRFPDLSNLFERADITEEADALLADVRVSRAAQLRMLAGPLPDVATGSHCTSPYDCPFLMRCWPVQPPNHISTLYRMAHKAAQYEEQGIHTIFDLPQVPPLGLVQERQRQAVQEGRMIVASTLADALRVVEYPFAALDFETLQTPIPLWNGCRPWDQVPAQFSCHVVSAPGQVIHHEWLAEQPGDPRPELARRLVDACRGAKVVLAYNASFEAQVVDQLAEALPGLAPELADLRGRLVDALPLVRDHVYHPDFLGSFSLKTVLPVLVPGAGYEGLPIADGGTASVQLRRLLIDQNLPPDEVERTRAALKEYCAVDTLGVVRLLERLTELAALEERHAEGMSPS
ncbi:MAG: DUF2779 domain-containing protein [Vicinamibacterales bacterium]